MTEETKQRKGRATKSEELSAFAEHLGLDMTTVGDYLADNPVALKAAAPLDISDPQALKESAMRLLAEHVQSGKANVAMVNGLKAMIDYADRAAPADTLTDIDRMPLIERAHALPKDHAVELIQGEIARLDGQRAAYFAKLDELGAE